MRPDRPFGNGRPPTCSGGFSFTTSAIGASLALPTPHQAAAIGIDILCQYGNFMDPDSQSFEAILAIIPIAPMQFSNRSAQSPGGSPGSGLAPWAVIRGAAGKLDRRDLCAATRASPAPFTVRDEEGSGQPIDKPLGAGCGVDRRV